MGNLLFFSLSCAYRHAARLELQAARTLPCGAARNAARQRASALRELEREEAWLEGQVRRAALWSASPRRLASNLGFLGIDKTSP
jgi:hypothetical protein